MHYLWTVAWTGNQSPSIAPIRIDVGSAYPAPANLEDGSEEGRSQAVAPPAARGQPDWFHRWKQVRSGVQHVIDLVRRKKRPA